MYDGASCLKTNAFFQDETCSEHEVPSQKTKLLLRAKLILRTKNTFSRRNATPKNKHSSQDDQVSTPRDQEVLLQNTVAFFVFFIVVQGSKQQHRNAQTAPRSNCAPTALQLHLVHAHDGAHSVPAQVTPGVAERSGRRLERVLPRGPLHLETKTISPVVW